MRAALEFAHRLRATGALDRVARIGCTLYGSLGATGIGHGTPDAVVAGLRGLAPETCDPADVRSAWTDLRDGATLRIDGSHEIPFSKTDIVFEPRTRLPGHPNAMTITAWDAAAGVVAEETYYSVGGGFIRRDGEDAKLASAPLPYSYADAASLLALCDEHGLSIAEVARLNETAERPEEELSLIHI